MASRSQAPTPHDRIKLLPRLPCIGHRPPLGDLNPFDGFVARLEIFRFGRQQFLWYQRLKRGTG